MNQTEQLRPEQLVGLVARSAEGTAAKGMPIKGNEDLWVEIQTNTFRNWVNEHLKQYNPAGGGGNDLGGRPVVDLAEDFRDGTRLCALVEVLTKKRLPRWNPKPVNQHHHLENVSTALKAIEEDGVKLVNIGEHENRKNLHTKRRYNKYFKVRVRDPRMRNSGFSRWIIKNYARNYF